MSPAQDPSGAARKTRTDADALDLYGFARDEELRRLGVQHDELDSMRQRTAQYLAFVGAATAFLAGSGLKAPNRDLVFYILASVASALSLATIAACVGVLLALEIPPKSWRPRPRQWSFLLKPGALLAAVESDVPRPDKADLVKYSTQLYAEMSEENSVELGGVRKVYVQALALGALQIIVWAALVWARA